MLTRDPAGGTPRSGVPVLIGTGTERLPAGWEAGSGPRLWRVRASEYAARAAADEWLLDAEERARVRAFVRDRDRDRYRVAHVVLRRLLGAYLDEDPAAVGLVREPCPGCGEPHGRPAVAGAPFHFSLAHSGDLALLAFADTPVGIDVEADPSLEAAAEIGAMLHPRERAEVAAVPHRARPASVGRCWTRKEAYLKGVGIGLGEDPAVTYVGAGPAPAAVPGWSLTDVPVPAGHAAACAVRRPG
ncbi:4'-phosphopantetheinyl transferase superfamily protein [Streptomyces kurssanovii]|uniref:4'-phosphopantetheinyl transferase superfamily protein n=1 Tax=Streptomyces kurssanovii TaxID=67312 RepID=A0ABV3HYK9_9ACTN